MEACNVSCVSKEHASNISYLVRLWAIACLHLSVGSRIASYHQLRRSTRLSTQWDTPILHFVSGLLAMALLTALDLTNLTSPQYPPSVELCYSYISI
jgi:hypothetical protein